jgi:syntaxin-binding protein 1
MLNNLELLGVQVARALKDNKNTAIPVFPQKPPPAGAMEEYALSRFEPNLKRMLEEHVQGTLDQTVFPFTKPHTDANEAMAAVNDAASSSLRSAKPTWAKSRHSAHEPRQRIIVFMAGGATYSESRSCYEVSREHHREVFLATSHMITPSLFMRQVGDLSVDKRRLGIPAEQPKPKAPAHLFEKEPAPAPSGPMGGAPQKGLPAKPHGAPGGLPGGPRGPMPPTGGMANMSISGQGPPPPRPPQQPIPMNGGPGSHLAAANRPPPSGKPGKDPEKKKKHHFFSSKK